MRKHNIPLCYRKSKKIKDILIMPPGQELLLTLIGSNYPCLELIFMVSKVFEPLKFDCIPIIDFLRREHPSFIIIKHGVSFTITLSVKHNTSKSTETQTANVLTKRSCNKRVALDNVQKQYWYERVEVHCVYSVN